MMNVSEQDADAAAAAADDDVEKTVTSQQMTSSTSLDNLQVSIIYLLLANVYFRDAGNCLERQLFKDTYWLFCGCICCYHLTFICLLISFMYGCVLSAEFYTLN